MEMTAKAACFVLLSMIMVAPHAEASIITCGQVSSALYPCLTYLSSGGAVPANCCSGVKGLINAAACTTADRQAACKCLKSFANSVTSINTSNVAALPGKCGVNIPYKLALPLTAPRYSEIIWYFLRVTMLGCWYLNNWVLIPIFLLLIVLNKIITLYFFYLIV